MTIGNWHRVKQWYFSSIILLMGVFLFCFPLFAWSADTSPKKIERMIVGAGSVSGVYFPAAGAICRDVNLVFNRSLAGSIHCAVEPTQGSVENVQLLLDGDIQFGVVQSDVISNAWKGLPPFEAKNGKLRSLVSLYSETLTIVTRGDSGIREWGDFQGKTISIGQKGSGSRRTATELMKSCGVSAKVVDENQEMTPDSAAAALRNKEIDAYFFVVGHPNENIWNTMSTAGNRIIKIPESCSNKIVREFPYYVKSTIPGGLYPNLSEDVPSLAVKATLATTTDMDEETAYQFTRTIVEKLYRFSRLNPDFMVPDPRSLFEGLVAPLHIGAFKYFQEIRVIEVKAGRPDPGKEWSLGPALEGDSASHWKLGYDAPIHLAKLGVGFVRDNDPVSGLVLNQPLAAATTMGGAIHWLVTGGESLPQ